MILMCLDSPDRWTQCRPRRGDALRPLGFVVGTALALMLPAAPLGAHPCLCNGDANLDGVFNEEDFWFTVECLGQLPIDICVNADINCDGTIDEDDVNPDDPFSGDTALICLKQGTLPEECCPGHFPCGSALSGSCFEPGPTPACDNLQCCIDVCSSDPFCCDFIWDQFCSASALEDCDLPGDCDDDSDVDLDDYATLSSCITGPVFTGPLPPDCACVDFDGDEDCDLMDFQAFQLFRTTPP